MKGNFILHMQKYIYLFIYYMTTFMQRLLYQLLLGMSFPAQSTSSTQTPTASSSSTQPVFSFVQPTLPSGQGIHSLHFYSLCTLVTYSIELFQDERRSIRLLQTAYHFKSLKLIFWPKFFIFRAFFWRLSAPPMNINIFIEIL